MSLLDVIPQEEAPVSDMELAKLLVKRLGEGLDYDELLPCFFQLNGKPMNVVDRRPMFTPLFRKERKTKREIYLCGRQTGKTSQVAASMLMNLVMKKFWRQMYVAPLALYTHKMHHDYMSPMIDSCTMPFGDIQDSKCINNVNQKTFRSQSRYLGVSCFNSPRGALGSAIDSIDFDETQDINIDFIPQIRETTRTSEFRYETYTGTARGIENTIQTLFDESSQGEWHIRCDCKGYPFGIWVVPTRERDAIKMIQRHGIACPRCEALLDVTNGQWVHGYPDRMDPVKCAENNKTPFAGYHIPATIVYDAINPFDRYVETIWDKLYGLRPYSEAQFFQEILGISSDQGGRPITAAEIREVSTLDFNLGKNKGQISADEIRRTFKPGEYLSVSGGSDWGGSEITSFTVGTVVGWHHQTGTFHCLGAISPRGVPDNERHFPLAAFFRKLGPGVCKGIGADAGFVGSVQNRNLQKAAGIRTLSIAYGTTKLFYKMLPSNNCTVDRTTLIWIVYQLLKDKKLLLPKGDEFSALSENLLATFIEDMDAPNGITIRRYCRYKQKADDFLHALGYAIFACAVDAKIDLPSMIGLQPRMSANAGYLHIIGEESASDQSFGMNEFSR